MEALQPYYALIAAWCGLVVVILAGWRAATWIWLRPKNLERRLRKQGFAGNSYKLLHGYLKEIGKLNEDAKSRPISFDDDVKDGLVPFPLKTIRNYGFSNGACVLLRWACAGLVVSVCLGVDDWDWLRLFSASKKN